MRLFRTYVWEILLSIGCIFSYLFLRLTNIMTLPIFTDEAIYTRWSQIARFDASWRFISLTDGKQPMYVWWDVLFMHLLKDPLLAGRLVSVLFGIVSMVGLYFLGKEIFKNKWIGFISAVLYVIYPFALVYDRMALYDTMVGSFAIWSLYLEILMVRNPRAWLGFTLALVLGGGMLTKTSDFFSIYLLPATLLLFHWEKKDRFKRFAKWVGCAILAVGLANVYYSVLRLSPFYHIINDKNAVFVYPIANWLHHPFLFFLGNFHGLWDWFSTYTTYPVLLLMIASLFVAWKYTREKLLLLVYFFVPFLLLALFGKVLYPRFILFMTLPLLPLLAFFFLWVYQRFKMKVIAVLIAIIFLSLWARSDYLILTDFARAPIASSDSTQYINGWPAGGGMKEVVAYLATQAKTKKIYVASEGTFGSLPTLAVEIYLGTNTNIQKGGLWPVPSIIPHVLLQKAKTMDTYMIFYQQPTPSQWPLTLIAQYKKGIGSIYYLRLYKVKSS